MDFIKRFINHDEVIPLEFHLSQNYPNPFRKKTVIKYCVAYKTKIVIEVFNPTGEMIKKLLDEKQKAGTYEIEFNAENLPDGIYYCRLIAGEFSEIKKMKLKRT